MRKIINRLLDIQLPPKKSAFLWGPRKVGKTYWIHHSLKAKPIHLIDLLKTDVFAAYASRPALLRERIADGSRLIIIDEVQKIPALLDEVHWLIENRKVSFLLTGSSARKLKRGHANMLGGRAWKRVMTPLSWKETQGFDLERVIHSGLIPSHFLANEYTEELRAYVADYLKEEIAAEALVENLPAFSDFLRVAALTSSELLNYANVGREVGVSSKVVRRFFEILEDTYLGYRVPPWVKSRDRRLIETEKFYLFDVGVSNFLSRRRPLLGTPEFGKSFEHYILMELKAYQAYRCPELDISFWRTSTGLEVDFILGQMEVAIEVKGGNKVHDQDLKPLKVLAGENKIKRCLVVCLEKEPRKIGQVEIMPWQEFLSALWQGDIIG